MLIIDRRESIIENSSPLLEQLLDASVPKYVLGINEFADEVIRFCNVRRLRLDGVIDDFTEEMSYRNHVIRKMTDIDEKDALVISCVIDRRIPTTLDKLKSNGFDNVLTYLELFLLFPEEIETPHFCDNNFLDVGKNRDQYDWLHDILHDSRSRTVLERITDFRYNFSADALREFKLDLERQYFDDFVNFGDNEAFVDCGGYNGDTTSTFIRLNPRYRKIYYIEPSRAGYERSMANLGDHPNIVFFNNGVACRNSVLRFNSRCDYENRIDPGGDCLVAGVRLDDVIVGPVSYIKMDIEGAEHDALIGARETIMKQRPKLAICVYHEQSDFWRIPRLIRSFTDEYAVYLRHYTEGILETVMYFLPK